MFLRSLRSVSAALPFHLDDSARVNDAFLCWRRHADPEDKRLVELWTYCYIYRYFMIKLAASDRHVPLSFDRLVASTFADVQQHLSSIRRPDCYAGWVSVICRNTFINYLRTRRSAVSLDVDSPALVVEDPPATEAHDAAVVHHSICAAIDTLPDFLRNVARMRLIEQRSYEAIHQETGKPPATLRTYVNRALRQLRQDERLVTLLEELRD